jgi:hypothetical protein
MTRELARAQISGATVGGVLNDMEARASEIELHWGELAEAFCPDPLISDGLISPDSSFTSPQKI